MPELVMSAGQRSSTFQLPLVRGRPEMPTWDGSGGVKAHLDFISML
jgi:hypothetical protein